MLTVKNFYTWLLASPQLYTSCQQSTSCIVFRLKFHFSVTTYYLGQFLNLLNKQNTRGLILIRYINSMYTF